MYYDHIFNTKCYDVYLLLSIMHVFNTKYYDVCRYTAKYDDVYLLLSIMTYI